MQVWKRFVLACLLGGPLAVAQIKATNTPKTVDGTHVERGGRSGLGAMTQTDERINALQTQVKESPGSYVGYDHLGSAYFQKARETGDVAYYELAEKTLTTSVELMPTDGSTVDPLVNLALVYMGKHRFSDALKAAQTAIAAGTGNLTAFAIEGDAYTDIGEYDQAAAAYNTLRTLGAMTASPVNVRYMDASRLSYLRFLDGDTSESIELINQATMAALQLNVPKENLAWLYYESGQRYFLAGDLQHADRAYSSALEADPNHYRSLAGLAQVRTSQGRYDDAITLYKSSTAIVPFPQYIAELGDVYLKTGRDTEAQQQYDLVEYVGLLGKLNQVLNNRELALFYADQNIKLPLALQLAQAELEVRHDIYTWDTLAWVLFKNRRIAEAQAAMEKALQLHTKDPVLLFHSGEIEHASGNDTAAKEHLTLALNINPHFHVFYAQQAVDTLNAITRAREKGSDNAAN